MIRTPVLLSALAIAACGGAPPAPPPEPSDPPASRDIESVVFLVGDAGGSRMEVSPLVHRLREDVERWSAAVTGDSAVLVLFLGDNVYPVGVRDRAHRDFAEDSARLHAQVWALEGPQARRRGTRGVFLPGNHDWGNARAPKGLQRLSNQEALLSALRAQGGGHVSMVPAAGGMGPESLFAHGYRILATDTHGWLQSRDTGRRSAFAARLSAELEGAGADFVLLAAHHPYVSAGPHGGAVLDGLDPLLLLRRAGAVVQDTNAEPYRELTAAIGDAIEASGARVIAVAGHDHSLQVLRGAGARDPVWTLVSGSGSSVTAVGRAPGLAWALEERGYMKLLITRSAEVHLVVESAPAGSLACGAGAPGCVEGGVAAFRTTRRMRLR